MHRHPSSRLPTYASNQVPRTPATSPNGHMHILEYVRQSGGVARSGQLRDAGFPVLAAGPRKAGW